MSRITLITGANRGMGLACVHLFLDQGYEVICTSRDVQSALQATSGIDPSAPLHHHALDVTEEKSVDGIRRWVESEFGRLDILINNAGINRQSDRPASAVEMDELRAMVETNLIGPCQMCSVFLPMMKEHGHGRIVNVSSNLASFAEMGGHAPGYSATKAALNVLSVKLAAETEGFDILINNVSPGWVRTDMGGDGAPRSPEQGARSILWAAELPSDGPNGGFFKDGERVEW